MKKFFLIFAALFFLPCLSAIGEEVDANLRIGTYNLRMQNLDKGDNVWAVRRFRLVRSIRDNAFDIFGVQEVCEKAQKDLAMDLSDRYSCIFFSPYSQDGIGDKAQGVFFDKKRFKLVSYHWFWISDTPDQVSENDHFVYNGTPHSYCRGGQCLTFKDKVSGKFIFFLNHHGILNGEENLRYAPVLADMEKKYNPKGYPSFFVGDFNARVDNPSHKLWREHWRDAADIVSERPCTMNAFDTDPKHWDKAKHIDFIYYRNIDAPSVYECNQTLYDGFCASDHFPVWADFKI